MRYLLDTNICNYIIKHRPEKVFKKFKRLAVGQIGISSITYSELFFGVQKSLKKSQNEKALEQFASPLEVLPYPQEAAGVYGEIRAHLESKGAPIGPLDTLIAAHARYLDVALVTNNASEFSSVSQLRVENWVK